MTLGLAVPLGSSDRFPERMHGIKIKGMKQFTIKNGSNPVIKETKWPISLESALRRSELEPDKGHSFCLFRVGWLPDLNLQHQG